MAFPRQMNHVRGQFSGASGSLMANSTSPALSRSTTNRTISSSLVAPA
jgi:hypothetical protein